MTQTPGDTLRAAADRLHILTYNVHADITANPYWASTEHPPHDYPNLYARGVDNGLGGPAGAYAAALHPGVGYALADQFDEAADLAAKYPELSDCQDPSCDDFACALIKRTLAVARALLGETPAAGADAGSRSEQ